MISNVTGHSATYTAQNVQKEESPKGSKNVDKSEALDKVSTLKEQIQNGTYRVDIEKTAQAVAEELI